MTELLDWQARHNAAIEHPEGFERSIVLLRSAIGDYIRESEVASDGGEWRDYVLGTEVGGLLDAFVGLLNGPTGRLDCGTLDTWAREMAARIGYDMDMSTYAG